MTKTEIQLWWELMKAQAHIKYLYCKLRMRYYHDEDLISQHNHMADLWMRISDWSRGY